MIPYCTRTCEKLLCKSGICQRVASLYYDHVIEKEIALANITSEDKVVCIGGGSTPFTACLIAEKTGAQVTVIDYDKCVMEKARNFILKWNLDTKVTLECVDGLVYNVSKYTVVHVAMQVTPQRAVYQRMLHSMSVGGRLILRRPRVFLSPFYEALPVAEYEKAYENVWHPFSMMKGSCLFLKNEVRLIGA
ncbi:MULTISPECIES: class I SAM-dependent methyltransferase [Bacillaceae]|uniref:Class I SAM-dependent methyltransferase n=1 Tax=Evansella alkalicola TaxID=745819 RepID=A0ABS6JRX2_9BACI|nr:MULTISPECIES: class I SAM-dependent methyltransferase [Bacillaceae]MBU9721233.1 class I SAM-dependent methyltransferase [Bacillus alkalicola]